MITKEEYEYRLRNDLSTLVYFYYQENRGEINQGAVIEYAEDGCLIVTFDTDTRTACVRPSELHFVYDEITHKSIDIFTEFWEEIDSWEENDCDNQRGV